MDRPPPMIEAGLLPTRRLRGRAQAADLGIGLDGLQVELLEFAGPSRSALGAAAGVANGSETVLPPV